MHGVQILQIYYTCKLLEKAPALGLTLGWGPDITGAPPHRVCPALGDSGVRRARPRRQS